MLTPSLPELVLILVVGVVIFGSGKLPGLGLGLGKAIRNFKTSVGGKPKVQPQAAEAKRLEPASPSKDE